MRPEERFVGQGKDFWASVRTASEFVGYSARGAKTVRAANAAEIGAAFEKAGLSGRVVTERGGQTGEMLRLLSEYFDYRAEILNRYVEPRLMDARDAKEAFEGLRRKLKPTCPLPMNKQKGEKKAPAYLTGMVNMLIEANAEGFGCDYDPRSLTTFTREGLPLRTLARRVDGAFPTVVNPVAVWEIKEYYYTTTFGSRVADGIYETLLDGMEIEELKASEGIEVLHFLIVDSHFTWWECGRSYLCRILDMLHMGYIDEALFGREVLERMPDLVREWVRRARERSSSN